MHCMSETGVELFTRLVKHADVSAILPVRLPVDIFSKNSVVELSGPSGSAKSLLLMDMVVRCILDTRFGGCAGDVVFFDLDHRFDFHRLLRILQNTVNINEPEKTVIIGECLDRLRMVPCYTYDKLLLSLYQIENTRNEKQSKTSLICIDSVTSVYWSTRLPSTSAFDDNLSYSKLASVISRMAKQFDIPFIVTTQTLFQARQSHSGKAHSKPGNHPSSPDNQTDITGSVLGKIWQKLPAVRISTSICPQTRHILARIADRTGTGISLLDVEVLPEKLITFQRPV